MWDVLNCQTNKFSGIGLYVYSAPQLLSNKKLLATMAKLLCLTFPFWTVFKIHGVIGTLNFQNSWISSNKMTVQFTVGPTLNLCLFFSCKTTIEAIHGLMSQVIKDKLFNQINIAWSASQLICISKTEKVMVSFAWTCSIWEMKLEWKIIHLICSTLVFPTCLTSFKEQNVLKCSATFCSLS